MGPELGDRGRSGDAEEMGRCNVLTVTINLSKYLLGKGFIGESGSW